MGFVFPLAKRPLLAPTLRWLGFSTAMQVQPLAFVRYTHRCDAEGALPKLHRMIIGGKEIHAEMAKQVRRLAHCT